MTTLQKTLIKPTWKVEEVHAKTSKLVATQMMVTMKVLAKYGEEAKKEWETEMRESMKKYFVEKNVKTPIEFAQAKAELEANVYGSEIEIWGDDKEAHFTYKTCGVWKAMEACGVTKEQMDKMSSGFESCVKNMAHEFGFQAELKFEGEMPTITYRK